MSASKSSVEGIYRLTSTQEGILFHAIQAPESGVYFQQFTCLLRGTLDAEHLRSAWQRTLDRHPGARALFSWEGRERPLQVVRRRVELPFELREDADLVRGGARLEDFLRKDRERGFALDRAPLMRVTLLREQANLHRLVWSFHHVLLDGWSMRLFLDQVLESYAALCADTAPTDAPTSAEPAFEEYVGWLQTRDPQAGVAFWRGVLSGFEAPTDLRLPRPDREGSAEHAQLLSKDLSAALIESARGQRITLNTLVRAAWALLLGTYSGEDDVVFGATVSGRTHELDGVESIVGMCIHTIPVRARLPAPAEPLGEWMRMLQKQQLDAGDHDTTPLVEIHKASDVAPGRPLFDSIIVFENHPVEVVERSGPGALAIEEPRYVERSNFPLALLVLPGERLGLTFVYDRARFAGADIDRLAANLVSILEGLAADPALPRRDLPVPATAQREQLEAFAAGPGATTTQRSVLDLIRDVGLRTPDAPAFVADGLTVTYAQLARRSRELADAARARGLARGGRAALMLERSPDMVAAIVAVLECGAAYVPIDPDGPAERAALMINDAGADLVVANRASSAVLRDVSTPLVCVEDVAADASEGSSESPTEPDGAELAYVLFTSGSTGAPKGVEVTHGNLLHSTTARFDFYGGPAERFLLLSPYHFDSSVAGLFWTLCSGGTLILPPPGGERDVRALAELVERERVTHTLCLPSLYELLLEASEGAQLRTLDTVVVAGEACPSTLVSDHHSRLPTTRLVNEYGPTEATVWASAHIADADDAERGTGLPIGKAIGSTQVYLLGQHLAPVPPGVPGEIFLGGDGVARGYCGDPERTAQRFLELAPLGGPPQRLYRTGDLARFRADGALEFLGRADRQVKIRGQRIELGEIEARLVEHPNVQAAAVVAREDSRRRTKELVAYAAVGSGPAPASEELRAHVATALPEAMVPATFVTLEQLPRTSTGKLDRKALPDPGPLARGPREIVAPGDEVEAGLARLWCEVLGLDEVSVEANFFELGGDSLLSIRIIARAHQRGWRVSPAQFADRPTVAGMAAAARAAGVPQTAAAQAPSEEPPPLTPIQQWFFGLELPEPHHWNQAVLVTLPEASDPSRVERGLRELRSRHDALRLRFVRQGSGWRQELAEDGELALEQIDLSHTTGPECALAVEREATRIQSSLELDSGVPWKAAYFRTSAGEPPRLLLALHHLVVDAVSWAILLEDVAALCTGAGDAPAEPSAPFAQWARALEAYARGPAIEAELPHWLALEGEHDPGLPIDIATSRDANTVQSEESVVAALDEKRTQALLRDTPAVYGTRVQDLLLAALVRALQPWTNRPALYLDVEAHGREHHVAELDVSRTVGWFTAVWPARLSIQPNAGPGESIKTIKEQLRAVPGGGIGFGLLRDLRGDAALRERLCALPPRDLLFNYLGRSGTAALPAAPETVGASRSDRGMRAYPLEVNALVEGDCFSARWTFSSALHRRSTIEELAQSFVRELGALVDHCLSPDAGGRTPSDFPLAQLDQSQLDRLADLLGDE